MLRSEEDVGRLHTAQSRRPKPGSCQCAPSNSTYQRRFSYPARLSEQSHAVIRLLLICAVRLVLKAGPFGESQSSLQTPSLSASMANLLAGYSQSTSSPGNLSNQSFTADSKGERAPSSPRFFTSSTADSANFALPAAVAAGCAKFAEYVHPPIDSSTFSLRFFCLSRKSCFRQPYRFVPMSFQESVG